MDVQVAINVVVRLVFAEKPPATSHAVFMLAVSAAATVGEMIFARSAPCTTAAGRRTLVETTVWPPFDVCRRRAAGACAADSAPAAESPCNMRRPGSRKLQFVSGKEFGPLKPENAVAAPEVALDMVETTTFEAKSVLPV